MQVIFAKNIVQVEKKQNFPFKLQGGQGFCLIFESLIFDNSFACELPLVHGIAINGRTHFSSLLTKWLVFLMNTIKGKVSLPQHSLYSLRPSMSIDVFLPLIIDFLCERSSLPTATASQNRMMLIDSLSVTLTVCGAYNQSVANIQTSSS